MKIYAVFLQYLGCDYYEIDGNEVHVFLDRKKAEECRDSYLIGPDSGGDIGDARICEYEVNE